MYTIFIYKLIEINKIKRAKEEKDMTEEGRHKPTEFFLETRQPSRKRKHFVSPCFQFYFFTI